MELPNEIALRRVVTTYARLRAAHGEAIGTPPLVQPTAEFFPDPFRQDGASVDRFLRRMLTYAPLSDDLAVELAVALPGDEQGGGCGSAACGTGGESRVSSVQELDDGYRVVLAAEHVGSADLLAASLARCIGMLVLHEAGEAVDLAAAEIASVLSGFGVLLANGAAVWAKACGGLRVAQATALPVEELAFALALFAAVHRCKPSAVRRHLGLTQREAFDVASDWTDSNPLIVDALRDRPARVASGALDVEPVRGPIGQWLHKRSVERAMRAPAAVAAKAETPADEARRRRLEEVRALLDDAGEAEG